MGVNILEGERNRIALLQYNMYSVPPTLLSTQRVGGGHSRRAVRGWGVNILEDARHWIGLLQYNLFTVVLLGLEPREVEDRGICFHG
jgi:hypothetical protein